MTYLLDSENRSIVIPDVLLTKQIISFVDFSIRGDVSTNFTVPNNSENRAILGYRGLNQLNRVLSKELSLYRNGNKIDIGRVVIQQDNIDQLDCFFVSGNANWINDFDGNIKDLDLSDYNVDFTVASIQARNTATDGVIFPLHDWAYRGQKLSDGFLMKAIRASGENYFFDFYPCIYLHTIVTRLFKNKNIKLAGDLFTDKVYKSIVFPQAGLSSSALVNFSTEYNGGELRAGTSTTTALTITTGVATKITFVTQSGDDVSAATDKITFTSDYDNVVFRAFLNFYGELRNGTIAIYKNGSSFGTQTFSNASSINYTLSTPVSSGDEFELYVTLTDPPIFPTNHITTRYLTWSTSFQVAGAGGTVTVATILPDIKEIDLVKYLAQRFNCLLEFDKNTDTLYFHRIDAIIKENAEDYSENLVSYSISYEHEFGKNNYVRSSEADELIGYKVNNLEFGDVNLFGSGVSDNELIKLPFKPSATVENTNLEMLTTYTPLITLEDNDEGDTYSTGGTNFTGLSKTDYETNTVIRIQDDNGTVAYSVIETVTISMTTTLRVYGTVTKTLTSGKIFKQSVSLNDNTLRELIVVPNTSLTSLGKSSVNIIETTTAGGTTVTNLPFAFYAKPSTGVTGIDDFRVGLNFGDVLGASNAKFGDLYLKTLQKIVGAPVLRARMIFPESVYKRINLARYAYLKTKDFEGYFIWKKIEGYKDASTEVDCELYYIQ